MFALYNADSPAEKQSCRESLKAIAIDNDCQAHGREATDGCPRDVRLFRIWNLDLHFVADNVDGVTTDLEPRIVGPRAVRQAKAPGMP